MDQPIPPLDTLRGRDLDVWCAQNVLGWTNIKYDADNCCGQFNGCWAQIPYFSTDETLAAWIRETTLTKYPDVCWAVTRTSKGKVSWNIRLSLPGFDPLATFDTKTLAEATCRACLWLIGHAQVPLVWL